MNDMFQLNMFILGSQCFVSLQSILLPDELMGSFSSRLESTVKTWTWYRGPLVLFQDELHI